MKIQQALTYLKAGFSVVPVHYGSKVPAKSVMGCSWSVYQERQATAEELARWFQLAHNHRLNLAAVCGPISGKLLVLDFDHEAEENFERWQELARPIAHHLPVAQTGKGFHVYMRVRGECRTLILARSAEGEVVVETRGRNNLCLLPGSKHPSGAFYEWIQGDETTIPLLNERQLFHLMGAASMLNEKPDKVQIPRPQPAGCSSPQSRSRYAEAALTNVIAELEQVRANRNHALNGAAYRLGRFVGAGLLDQAMVEQALRRACGVNGYLEKDGEQAVEATLRSGLTAGMGNQLGKG